MLKQEGRGNLRISKGELTKVRKEINKQEICTRFFHQFYPGYNAIEHDEGIVNDESCHENEEFDIDLDSADKEDSDIESEDESDNDDLDENIE